MKKILISVCLLLLTVAGCSAPPPANETPKIGAILNDLSAPWTASLGEYMKASASESGAELTVIDGKGSVSVQTEAAKELIESGYKAIILMAFDAVECDEIVRMCKEAKVKLVEVNCLTDSQDYDAFVGSDDVNAGLLQSEYLKEALPQNAKICYLMGPDGQSGQMKRLEGITKGLFDVRTDITVLEKAGADWSRDKAKQIALEWFETHTNIDAVVCQNDAMALGVIDAINDKGLQDKVIVAGVDGTPEAIAAIESGSLHFTVFQNAEKQAAAAIRAAVRLLLGEEVQKDEIILFEPITKDNAGDYMR